MLPFGDTTRFPGCIPKCRETAVRAETESFTACWKVCRFETKSCRWTATTQQSVSDTGSGSLLPWPERSSGRKSPLWRSTDLLGEEERADAFRRAELAVWRQRMECGWLTAEGVMWPGTCCMTGCCVLDGCLCGCPDFGAGSLMFAWFLIVRRGRSYKSSQ